jgi:Type II secretion system (T2SS), protein M
VSQRDRFMLVGVGVLLVVGAFWMLALHPKLNDLNTAKKDAASARSNYATARQEAVEFTQARRQFPRSYATMAKLGKSVPVNNDQASLVFQLNQAAEAAGVRFSSLSLSQGSSTTSSSSANTGTQQPDDTLGSVPADATATATAPTGATTATANLRVMHYDLKFSGDFFRLEDLVRNVKRLTWTRDDGLQISGRLLTVDSITFDSEGQKVTMSATAYLLPASEGLFAGATPAGPADATAAPAATTASSGTAAPPTAAVTP